MLHVFALYKRKTITLIRLRHLYVANSVHNRFAIDDEWQLHLQIRFAQANTAIAIFQMENGNIDAK